MSKNATVVEVVTEIVDKLIEATRLGGGFLNYRDTAIKELVALATYVDHSPHRKRIDNK